MTLNMASNALVSILYLLSALLGGAVAGTFTIFSNCPTGSVWYAFVGGNFPKTPQYQLLDPGPGLSWPYDPTFVTNDGSQISMKIARRVDPGHHDISQVEFGVDIATGKFWCDLSVVDGNAFAQDGFELYVDQCKSKDFPKCETLDCPPGRCVDGYEYPTDPFSTHSCPISANAVVGFCTGSGFGKDPCT